LAIGVPWASDEGENVGIKLIADCFETMRYAVADLAHANLTVRNAAIHCTGVVRNAHLVGLG
jgi:hypothetical protein